MASGKRLGRDPYCLCLDVLFSYTAELQCSKIQRIQSPGLLSVLVLKRKLFGVITHCSTESQHFGGASVFRVKV